MTPEELADRLDSLEAQLLSHRHLVLAELAWQRAALERLLGRDRLILADWQPVEQAVLRRAGALQAELAAHAASLQQLAGTELAGRPAQSRKTRRKQ